MSEVSEGWDDFFPLTHSFFHNPQPPSPPFAMPFCRSCIVSFSRSASLRLGLVPLTAVTLIRPRSCAAAASFLNPGSQFSAAKTFLHTSVFSPRQHSLITNLARQRRLSSQAASTVSIDGASPATPIKVHNPQFDESGKELTVDITDKAVRVRIRSWYRASRCARMW